MLTYCDDLLIRGRRSDAERFFKATGERFKIKDPQTPYLTKEMVLDRLGMHGAVRDGTNAPGPLYHEGRPKNYSPAAIEPSLAMARTSQTAAAAKACPPEVLHALLQSAELQRK